MAVDDLTEALPLLPPDWLVHVFDAVDSTQDLARAAARGGARHRSAFVADYQRAGRGRQGRTWQAPPGTALLLSLVFRDRTPVPLPWRWTCLASVALVEAIDLLVPRLAPAIKWPNDVMLGDRKLAGILAETAFDGRELVAIVGVGVNVSLPAADLDALGRPATSLSEAAGRRVERAELLAGVLGRLDAWLQQPEPELIEVWQARLWGRGQRVRLRDLGVEDDVVVLGAEADGSLRVRLADGSERWTTTGELIV